MTAEAADRFFRAYHKHCVGPDEDTLFNLLNAVHSLNDRMRKSGPGSLFHSRNFGALRLLRNLFHHEQELLHELKVFTVKEFPITAELAFICLVSRTLVDRALARDEKNRPQATEALNWYGDAVDIQPCIFNCAVDVFEAVKVAQYGCSSDEYREFEASYRFEEENGFDHRLSGRISCRAGDVDRLLSEVFSLRPRIEDK